MEHFIILLNTLPTDLMWLIQLVICYAALLLMLRFFSYTGLYVFIAIAIIAGNIEVLKIVKFSVLTDPIALGTVFVSSAYLATDIITEYFGAAYARKGILLGFASAILMLTFMVLTLGFHPLTPHYGSLFIRTEHIQQSLLYLFTPTFALLSASLFSYLLSQFFDVWVFQRIRAMTGKKTLWLRCIVSTALSALLDSIIFNVLAWQILTSHPVGFHTLFFTYLLPTYLIRIFITTVGTPSIYLAKFALSKKQQLCWDNE